MNITNAIQTMRVQRRLGKLSLEQQHRIIRRLRGQSSSELEWGRFMGILRNIHRTIAPQIAAIRRAEDNLSLSPSQREF
jgi:hypothetical protein